MLAVALLTVSPREQRSRFRRRRRNHRSRTTRARRRRRTRARTTTPARNCPLQQQQKQRERRELVLWPFPLTRASRAGPTAAQQTAEEDQADLNTGTFAYRPNHGRVKLLPEVPHAVRHYRVDAQAAAELLTRAMRAVLEDQTVLARLGVSRETAANIMHAAVVASLRRQHGGPVSDEEAAALRAMLERATKLKGGAYACKAGSAGTDKYAAAAKLALEALFAWSSVFSNAKLLSAKSRSATTDGCGLNLTLLAAADSGGRGAKAKDGTKKRSAKKRGKQSKEAVEPEMAPVRPEEMPIVCGGDFGRGGECSLLAARRCVRVADGKCRGGGDGGGAKPAKAVCGRGDAPQGGKRRGAFCVCVCACTQSADSSTAAAAAAARRRAGRTRRRGRR